MPDFSATSSEGPGDSRPEARPADSADAIRVLIVDDQELVRAGFRIILESEEGIVVVGETGTGLEALELAAALEPDVICMDVQMPGMDGLEATRRLIENRAMRAAVLMLTTFDRDDYLFAALRAGASGFLLKNAGADELINAVKVVARGDALLSPEVTRRVISRFGEPETGDEASGRRERADGRLTELTERELEVLRRLAQGMSNAEIAGSLYVGEATVKTHVSRILMKLDLRDRTQAVVFAYENGVVTPGGTQVS